MKTIWKFQLETTDKQSIEMPIGAVILSVQTQHDILCMWAMVDTEDVKETRFFEVFGTGHEVHCDMGVMRKHIGTYQVSGGNLVFHLFERL